MYSLEENNPNLKDKLIEVVSAVSSFIFSSIESIIIALAFCVVLYLLVATPHQVEGHSMDPSFADGEYLIANKLTYKFSTPQRGDVIIFKRTETDDYIKRIIGLPGDVVSIKDGKILINGELLDESAYLSSSVYTNGGTYLKEGGSIKVPQGQYFVCGDNRQHSSDSRDFGPISEDVIKGKAWLVYFPFSNFRFVDHTN